MKKKENETQFVTRFDWKNSWKLKIKNNNKKKATNNEEDA